LDREMHSTDDGFFRLGKFSVDPLINGFVTFLSRERKVTKRNRPCPA